jgi:hypothetical protein
VKCWNRVVYEECGTVVISMDEVLLVVVLSFALPGATGVAAGEGEEALGMLNGCSAGSEVYIKP